MRMRISVEKPNEVVFSLTITASASEFEQMRDELHKINGVYLITALRNSMTDVLCQARKIYWAKEPE